MLLLAGAAAFLAPALRRRRFGRSSDLPGVVFAKDDVPILTSPSIVRLYSQQTDEPFPDPDAPNFERIALPPQPKTAVDADYYTSDWSPWKPQWSVPSGNVQTGISYRVRLVSLTPSYLVNYNGKIIVLWTPQYQIQQQVLNMPLPGGQGYPIPGPASQWKDISYDDLSDLMRSIEWTPSIPDPMEAI
ncbi:hypothetical protein AB0M22_29125 [Nocardia sp. NPDC051756]|uniref:hypothetical protein n=1 Tax=Nocardia sp. NPDC051756 TaxID=3154751 RepID=UPI003449BE5F